MIDLYSARRGTAIAPSLKSLDGDTYTRLCRARDLIDECFDLPLDLDRMSRQACLSLFHFLRLFSRAFNKTPHQYLTEQRLQEAKRLLTGTDPPVTEICFAVGFQSLGSFSSLFHRQVGYSPLHYRMIASRQVLIPVLDPELPFPCCFLMMYGAKAVFKDNSGNWLSLTQHK